RTALPSSLPSDSSRLVRPPVPSRSVPEWRVRGLWAAVWVRWARGCGIFWVGPCLSTEGAWMGEVPGPLARSEGLLVESIGDELLVYDEQRRVAHSLNETVTLVWRACDGSRDLAGL